MVVRRGLAGVKTSGNEIKSHLKVAFCRTGSNAGSMCSVMSSISSGLPTRMQFSRDLKSLAFVMVVTSRTRETMKNNSRCAVKTLTLLRVFTLFFLSYTFPLVIISSSFKGRTHTKMTWVCFC